MIPYHGLPITPDTAAVAAVQGGHAFVSFAHPDQLGTAISVCQSFALDNGAFPAWRSGNAITDWGPYYQWSKDAMRYPSCDFAVVPDVIDGDEKENDALLDDWPLPQWFGAPVWHMHESFDRLERLASGDWMRICVGSSGEFSSVGNARWWMRMSQAMRVLCDEQGRPKVRIHGLRMLDPAVFSRLPLSSADSTNIGRNIGIDKHWSSGHYLPPTKAARAQVMRQRIESHNAPDRWTFSVPTDQGLLW